MSTEAVTTFHALAEWLLHADPDSPEWQLESRCRGWTNDDILIHLTCTMRELVKPDLLPPPDTTSIERTNDLQVAAFQDGTVVEHLTEYARLLPDALTVLADLQTEAMRDETFDLFDAGVYPVHLCADALVFDHYCHLVHDMTLGRALPPIPPKLIEPALAVSTGWLVAGIPEMSGAPLNAALTSPVGLHITGTGGGMWTLTAGPQGQDIAECRPSSGLPATSIQTSAPDFMLWGTHRSPLRELRVTFAGDQVLAESAAQVIHVY